jgi:hypothetical protein
VRKPSKRSASAPLPAAPSPAFVSVEAVVENLNGHLVLFVPLIAGGADLRSAARGISDIDGDLLKVVFPTWLAEDLKLKVGSRLVLDNGEGQLNIRLK